MSQKPPNDIYTRFPDLVWRIPWAYSSLAKPLTSFLRPCARACIPRRYVPQSGVFVVLCPVFYPESSSASRASAITSKVETSSRHRPETAAGGRKTPRAISIPTQSTRSRAVQSYLTSGMSLTEHTAASCGLQICPGRTGRCKAIRWSSSRSTVESIELQYDGTCAFSSPRRIQFSEQ